MFTVTPYVLKITLLNIQQTLSSLFKDKPKAKQNEYTKFKPLSFLPVSSNTKPHNGSHQ